MPALSCIPRRSGPSATIPPSNSLVEATAPAPCSILPAHERSHKSNGRINVKATHPQTYNAPSSAVVEICTLA